MRLPGFGSNTQFGSRHFKLLMVSAGQTLWNMYRECRNPYTRSLWRDFLVAARGEALRVELSLVALLTETHTGPTERCDSRNTRLSSSRVSTQRTPFAILVDWCRHRHWLLGGAGIAAALQGVTSTEVRDAIHGFWIDGYTSGSGRHGGHSGHVIYLYLSFFIPASEQHLIVTFQEPLASILEGALFCQTAWLEARGSRRRWKEDAHRMVLKANCMKISSARFIQNCCFDSERCVCCDENGRLEAMLVQRLCTLFASPMSTIGKEERTNSVTLQPRLVLEISRHCGQSNDDLWSRTFNRGTTNASGCNFGVRSSCVSLVFQTRIVLLVLESASS